MLELAAGDYRLEVAPERGGSVTRFSWRDQPLFRPACGPSILDVGSFPLVPFSNRIAFGRFRAGKREVTLAPNFPGSDHPHPLHGFGWLAEWRVLAADSRNALLEHHYAGGEWPWPYCAQQHFELSEDELRMRLTLTNQGDSEMPAGLGFHPYFPRDPDTVYRGLHRGEWQNDKDCLPQQLHQGDQAQDWWNGAPVGQRAVDTVYTDRVGPLLIEWPSRGLSLQMRPSASLPHTVIYSPAGENFFCVEPVSHVTDAVNRPDKATSIQWLAPGDSFAVNVSLVAATTQ
jgi:aldose 1-epimerase